MTEYTLDTDTTTLLLRGHAEVCAHAGAFEAEQLSITIITVEEILTGWYSQIRRARKDEQILRPTRRFNKRSNSLGGCGSCPWTKKP
jgi:predicted nucleic acid-binding protein